MFQTRSGWQWEFYPHAIAVVVIAVGTIFIYILTRKKEPDWRFDNGIGTSTEVPGVQQEQRKPGTKLNLGAKRRRIPAPIAIRNEIDPSKTCYGLYIHNNIGNEGAREVAGWLVNCQTTIKLTELDLYANQIGPRGAKALGYALANPLPTVAHTFLTDRIQRECTAIVASFSRSLESLNLDHNRLGDKGAQFLAKGLKGHPRLETLSLSANGISDQGATALVDVVLQTCHTLRVLRLCNNDIVGKMPIRKLAAALNGGSSSLEGLYLDGNDIGFEGANILATMLGDNLQLKDLSLMNCSIGTKGALALAEALKANRSLQMLHLEGNGIGEQGAQAFIQVMQSNKTIRSLKLAFGNNVSPETLVELERHCKR